MRCSHILYPIWRIEVESWAGERVFKCIKCAKILKGTGKHRILEAKEFNASIT